MELTMGLCVVPTSAARTRPLPLLASRDRKPPGNIGGFFRVETAVQRDADLLALEADCRSRAEAQLNRRCAATPTAAASAKAAAPRTI
jgi:hypothetical protein